MKILALEFSSDRRSVAVWDSTGDEATAGGPAVVAETGGRSTRAFALIEAALARAGLEREQIECVAIGTGPGSYTGIRTAIALGQGWQLGRGIKLLGVSSVDCLAAQAHAEGLRGPVTVIVDAQRQEFYRATYALEAEGVRPTGPLQLAPRAALQACAAAGAVVIGPAAARWVPQARDRFPDAATVARLAARRTDFLSGDRLEPIYLREITFTKASPPRFAAPRPDAPLTGSAPPGAMPGR